MREIVRRKSIHTSVLSVGGAAILLVIWACPVWQDPRSEEEFREEVPFFKLPDLAVAGFEVTPSRAYPGNSIILEARVANRGQERSGSGDLVFSINGEEVFRQTIDPLDGQEEQVVETTWNTSVPGRFEVVAELLVDPDALEPAMHNNARGTYLRVADPDGSAPEIEVEIVTSPSSGARNGSGSIVALRASNPSFADVINVPIRMYADDELLGQTVIEELSAGDETQFQFGWGGPLPGEHVIRFEADLPDDFVYADAQKQKTWHVMIPEVTSEFPEPLRDAWSCLGPSIVSGGPVGTFDSAVGRIDSIAVHPGDPQVLLAGSPSGGIWKSVNGGDSWFPVGDKLHDLRATSIVFDPQNPQIVYCMTGYWYAKDWEPPTTVFKSLDLGQTWHTFSVGPGQGASTLAVRYANSGALVIYAATNQGVYRYTSSNPNAISSDPMDWTRIKIGKIRDLAVHPSDVDQVYATVSEDGLYYTSSGTSASGESAWGRLIQGDRMTVDIFRAAPSVVYVADWVVDQRVPRLDVYRSVDRGKQWTLQFRHHQIGYDNVYNPYFRVHPTKHVVYYGGVRLYKAELIRGVWREYQNTRAGAGSLHFDQQALVFDPHVPDQYYATNDGGIYRCQVVRGQPDNCTPRNSDLRTTQFYDIDVSPSKSDLMIGGTQDNSTLIYTGNPAWEFTGGGDGNFCLIATANNQVMYTQYKFLKDTARSIDGGKTWTPASNGLPTSNFYGSGLGGDDHAYITLDPSDPTGMSLLSQGPQVYATTDGGNSWNPMGPNPLLTYYINRVVVQPGTFDWITGDALGQLWIRKNGSWGPMVPRQILFSRVDGMSFAPTNPDVLYVIYGNVFSVWDRIHRLEKQSDGTWLDENITGDFPSVHIIEFGNANPWYGPVRLLSVSGDAYDDGLVYVGTDKGVWRGQKDTGTSSWKWTPYNRGFPLVPTVDLKVDPTSKELRAATWGRGVWSVITGP